MELLVINAFIDKNTRKPYNAGAMFESEDKDRVKELQEKGFLHSSAPEMVKGGNEETAPPKNEKTNEPDPPNS